MKQINEKKKQQQKQRQIERYASGYIYQIILKKNNKLTQRFELVFSSSLLNNLNKHKCEPRFTVEILHACVYAR